jgi:hypothetical protein
MANIPNTRISKAFGCTHALRFYRFRTTESQQNGFCIPLPVHQTKRYPKFAACNPRCWTTGSVYRVILTAELLKSINLFSRMLRMRYLSRFMLVDWMIGQNQRIRGFHGTADPPDESSKRAGKGFHQAFQKLLL